MQETIPDTIGIETIPREFSILNSFHQDVIFQNGESAKGELLSVKHTLELANSGYFNHDGNQVRFKLEGKWYNFQVDLTKGVFTQDGKILTIPVGNCMVGDTYIVDDNSLLSVSIGMLQISLVKSLVSVKLPDLQPVNQQEATTLNWRDS